jgi:5-methylcytosine-specific restriction endonuclease McrA
MAQHNKTCSICQELGHSKFYCRNKPFKPLTVRAPLPRPTKPIKQKGKRTLEYEHWRDTVARPYLETTYGLNCSFCQIPPTTKTDGSIRYHDVDHVLPRGSHYHLRMVLSNVRFLCRQCHTSRNV